MVAIASEPVPRIRHRCKGMTPEQRLEFFSEGGEGRNLYPADACDQQLRIIEEKRRRGKQAKPGKPDELDLSPEQYHSLCVKLEQITPSEPWARDMRGKVIAKKVQFKSDIAKELDRQALFPPGGSRETRMRRCPKCQTRWHPPQYLIQNSTGEDLYCTECFENARAPVDMESRRKSSGADTPIRTQSLAIGENGYEAVELIEAIGGSVELSDGSTSSSPIAVALDALANQNGVLYEEELPPEDNDSLINEIIAACEKRGDTVPAHLRR